MLPTIPEKTRAFINYHRSKIRARSNSSPALFARVIPVIRLGKTPLLDQRAETNVYHPAAAEAAEADLPTIRLGKLPRSMSDTELDSNQKTLPTETAVAATSEGPAAHHHTAMAAAASEETDGYSSDSDSDSDSDLEEPDPDTSAGEGATAAESATPASTDMAAATSSVRVTRGNPLSKSA